VSAAPAVVESREPATGAVLGSVPRTAARDVAARVAECAAVQALWAELRVEDRARYLRRAAQALIDERDELVALVCREQGRPRAEAELLELLPAVETLLWLAEEGPSALGDQRIGLSRTFFPTARARIVHEPLGVIAVISPAADPLAAPVGDVAIALLAGNGVVLKPSPFACLTGERIARVFARAGLPEGLLAIVHGGSDVGRALVEAPVHHVRFTGSADVGREVGEACARALKPSTLSLAGKDAMLVLADAPIDKAVDGGAWAAFANAGQAGGSVERAYVARGVFEPFLDGVVRRAEELRVGDPLDPRTEVGPLASSDRAERVRALVDDAVARGGVLHCGGAVEGPWFAPAVLTGVPEDAPVLRDEAPGPVLVVVPVDDVDEAIRLANATEHGLGASVWTEDRAQGVRVARALHAGMVWLNDHLVTAMAPQVPWGGVKTSGLGRARGVAALRECVQEKVVMWEPASGRPLWWHRYDAALGRTAEALALVRSVRDRDRSLAWRDGGVPLLRAAARSLRGGG
jgi:acyl-CoA reductase-like NAD-dependent aldehyde dehydrogenase